MTARRAWVIGSIAAAVLLCSSPAAAAPGCTISVTSVSFGTYDVFALGAAQSTGTIVFRCTGNARDITVTLSTGQSGTFASRTLTQGSEVLVYNLYMDAACTIVWGDGTGGTQTYFDPKPPNNSDVVVTIYGRIPASQDVSAGAYTDTVIATINF
jgi:spore coat protein U-like protein